MIDYIQSAADNRITTYSNIDKYKTRGLTLDAKMTHKRLNASLGFSYVGRYNQYKSDDPDLASFKWSPEANSVVAYSFEKIGMNINLYYKYTGSLPYYRLATVNGVEKVQLMQTGGYHWADLTINKKIHRSITFNTGVHNLFNVTRVNSILVDDNSSASNTVSSIAYGRSWFIGLSFNWNKK